MKRRGLTLPQRPLSSPRSQPQLPHERDESVDPPPSGAPRSVIRRAQRDLDAGRVDTDNYTRASAAAEPVLAAPSAARRRRSRHPPR